MGQFGKTMGERILEQQIKNARRKRIFFQIVGFLVVAALAKYLLT